MSCSSASARLLPGKDWKPPEPTVRTCLGCKCNRMLCRVATRLAFSPSASNDLHQVSQQANVYIVYQSVVVTLHFAFIAQCCCSLYCSISMYISIDIFAYVQYAQSHDSMLVKAAIIIVAIVVVAASITAPQTPSWVTRSHGHTSIRPYGHTGTATLS